MKWNGLKLPTAKIYNNQKKEWILGVYGYDKLNQLNCRYDCSQSDLVTICESFYDHEGLDFRDKKGSIIFENDIIKGFDSLTDKEIEIELTKPILFLFKKHDYYTVMKGSILYRIKNLEVIGNKFTK
jgi:hypothetical protein